MPNDAGGGGMTCCDAPPAPLAEGRPPLFDVGDSPNPRLMRAIASSPQASSSGLLKILAAKKTALLLLLVAIATISISSNLRADKPLGKGCQLFGKLMVARLEHN